MDKWFLIYCKPAQDTRAEENLERQGYIVFRPTIDVKKVGSQNSFKRESLFPRYLFIKVDPEIKSIAPIQSTFGVVSFVKFGDRYATAPECLIDKIKSAVDKKISFGCSPNVLQKGDDIYVEGHGFHQMKAIYCNPCGNERAMILMNILGNVSKLTVPLSCLSKVG